MGGHASVTGAPSSPSSPGVPREPRGFHGLGGHSHEPLPWALQGVLGAEVPAGLYPCTHPGAGP